MKSRSNFTRAAYMRQWRHKLEIQRRQAVRDQRRGDILGAVGLYLSAPSSMQLWERPGVFIRVQPVATYIGYTGKSFYDPEKGI